VAKEFKISSEALMELLRGMDVATKSHMSTIDDEIVEQVRRHFEAQKATAREESAKKEQELARRREQARPIEHADESRRRLKKRRRAPTQAESQRDRETVKASVKRVMARMEGGKARKRRRKQKVAEEVTTVEPTQSSVIRVTEDSLTVSSLATMMGREPTEVIRVCMGLGLMATVNQRLDLDTVETVADELGFVVERVSDYVDVEEVAEAPPEPRPPVVTVMGHVDHGKTSLLDYIRRANVVGDEDGGITQHMGAYEVVLPEGRITFIDTPGHEAFTAMRTRGSQVTDIVVLVVAAGEGVMPQTVEAIDHAKAANVPIIVALNKMDLPDGNPEMVRQQLAARGITVEAWGGDTMEVLTSAKTGDGVDKLLESVLLQAEVMELQAPRGGRAVGIVLEARLDPGFGPVTTVLVKTGTLRLGDTFVVGSCVGKVRALIDERNERIDEAPPSKAVQVAGISGVPQAGDTLQVTASEKAARDVSERRQEISKQKELAGPSKASLEDLFKQIKDGHAKELRLIVKGDVQGSIEALSDSLGRMGSDDVTINIIRQGIGAISESDVLLASASEAIIIGFRVRPAPRASELADKEGVETRSYRVIYECVEDIQQALEGLLEPEMREKTIGRVDVRQIFRHPRAGTIAGCYVLEGYVERGAKVRVLRDGVVVADSRIGSLKRFKEDVKEVQTGFECGVIVENFGDVHQGDILEVYQTEEVARSLN
jgi:translation initiation factor IF-2